MSYKVVGVIQSISTIETNEYGSKLTCVVKNDETYNNLYILEYFNNKDVSYLEKFIQYNKVGDQVEVEFNISCKQGTSKAGNPYAITKLSLWKCTKINGASQWVDAQPQSTEGDGDLPF